MKQKEVCGWGEVGEEAAVRGVYVSSGDRLLSDVR